MTQPVRVIRRKLQTPALPDHYAARPRLQRLITRLIAAKRVVVISAAAGSGKTTAVVAVAHASRRSVAWLTVDRPDRAPGRLLTYLEASLAQHRPSAAGVATGALAAGIPHAEAAGLLAESLDLDGDPPVIVLDELDRLGESPEAWQVLEALLRYAPTGTGFVLISRRDIPTAVCALPSPDAVAVLSDADLAFTAEEAAEALAHTGRSDVDAAAAVRASAGWVTGVLFQSWRAEEHLMGQGGETDPLYDYLSSQILGELAGDEREFLIRTALLDEVTAARAQALGIADADRLLAALRPAHLPATWEADGRTLRCHSYFREYLTAQLERRGEDEVRRLRLAYGHRLAAEGHDEEATEELLRAGAADHAVTTAERAIVSVVERLDIAVAERWLQQLAPEPPGPASALATAELMLALARDEVGLSIQIADRLAADGERQALASSSDRAALLMVWSYLHIGRVGDVDAVLAAAGDGPGAAAMRYARDALFGAGERDRPLAPDPPPPGPIGAIVANAHYALGRLGEITDAERSGWSELVERPWRTAALRARGQTEQALALFEDTRARGSATPTMLIFAGPEVLMDAGRWDDARALLDDAHRVAASSGSVAYQGFCWVIEAKLALRRGRDATAARAALAQPACRRACGAFRFIDEVADTWMGLAELVSGSPETARAVLERATDGMRAGDRILELPTAAVYLAEALSRCGDERAADGAADLALHTARRQGSDHLLLQALADFPAVASRRLEAEAGADSEWHALGQAMSLQHVRPGATGETTVELAEFGRRALSVSGMEVKPRIAKSYELLAYLVVVPDRTAPREDLLQALFDDRRDDAARAYLRQAIHQLREALPGGALRTENGQVALDGELTVASESVTVERALAEAARRQGADRLRASLAAIAVYDRGEYLPGPRAGWADARQQRLAELVTQARYQAAVLSFGAGDYELAERLAGDVLHADPFHEAAWRVRMRIARARGDEEGVLRAYHACEAALAAIPAGPSQSTRALLARERVAARA